MREEYGGGGGGLKIVHFLRHRLRSGLVGEDFMITQLCILHSIECNSTVVVLL